MSRITDASDEINDATRGLSGFGLVDFFSRRARTDGPKLSEREGEEEPEREETESHTKWGGNQHALPLFDEAVVRAFNTTLAVLSAMYLG